jgi:8-oxo-dGTP pyrophosphatase MutT (NUDIX family)
MPLVERVAARLLVLAPTGRVLLLRLEPGFREPFWVTPGGGVDGGETLEQAAQRELQEEVGRTDLSLGPIVWSRDVEFTWQEWVVRQREHTFLVGCTEEFEAVVVHADQEPIVGSAWFGPTDLSRIDDTVYPEDLGDRLTRLLGRR